jgi:uncharacterized protein YjbI with pentapeptide repeats
MSKQRTPLLNKNLAPTALADLNDVDLDCAQISGGTLAKQSGERMRLDAVRLLDADLSETKVRALSWLDVECVRCQLSLSEWPQSAFTRVAVLDSRATGLRLEQAELQDVRFVGCQLDYAAFPGSKFARVTFEKCRLHHADFGDANLEGTVFAECDLQGAAFVGAKLANVDISTCSGTDLRIEARDVRGLIVNSQQAAALARLFGIVVRES